MIPPRLAANTAAFVAAVIFCSSVVAVRVVVQEVPPLSLAVLRFGQGGLVLVLLLILGVLGGALAFYLWTFALTRLTPTQVAVYINLNPLVAAVLGAALLAEHLTTIFAVGFGAVLSGVLLVNWPKRVEAAPTFRSR